MSKEETGRHFMEPSIARRSMSVSFAPSVGQPLSKYYPGILIGNRYAFIMGQGFARQQPDRCDQRACSARDKTALGILAAAQLNVSLVIQLSHLD
ncbi:hypothetical protein [uncultured Roseibium sp.]|uniref:hypothetical protein n=1 Tax=uncultured Roseibium sp. TaxID=1936171 RepID=UPI00261DB8E5|nr:hypothetical protein [uncultured Roseibium sp.]